MKPSLIRNRHSLQSIDFDDSEYPFFYNPWHYHPELELTLVLKSCGQRLIGDNVEHFSEGDLVLVGSNLPHVWKNDKSYFEAGSTTRARAIVVKFLPDFAGKELMQMREMASVKQLLHEKAMYGMKLTGHLKEEIAGEMCSLAGMGDTERMIHLLKILYRISVSTDYVPLASMAYGRSFVAGPDKDNLRIDLVLDYLLRNYDKAIELETVSGRIHMNKNAFCRFFRQKTGKSMVELLSEIRIGKACELLQQTEQSIDVVGRMVGFNNISNFNRTFKLVTGTTPAGYRRKITNIETAAGK